MERSLSHDESATDLADSSPTAKVGAGEGSAEPPLVARMSHRERLASLGVLAAGVGHEINNPLASIMAGIRSLARLLDAGLESSADLDEAREICQLLEREVDRCKDTTDKLRLLAQPYSSTPREVDFNLVVADTLSLLRFQMRQQGIALEEDLDPELPIMWARDSGMRSVCMNVVLNAVQAMPQGGRLRVSTAARDGALEFAVQDDGPGIPEDVLERIWDPFFSTKPPGQGTGLGLPVTAAIVRRHAGSIRVDHPAGGGARFTIRLPLRQSEGDPL